MAATPAVAHSMDCLLSRAVFSTSRGINGPEIVPPLFHLVPPSSVIHGIRRPIILRGLTRIRVLDSSEIEGSAGLIGEESLARRRENHVSENENRRGFLELSEYSNVSNYGSGKGNKSWRCPDDREMSDLYGGTRGISREWSTGDRTEEPVQFGGAVLLQEARLLDPGAEKAVARTNGRISGNVLVEDIGTVDQERAREGERERESGREREREGGRERERDGGNGAAVNESCRQEFEISLDGIVPKTYGRDWEERETECEREPTAFSSSDCDSASLVLEPLSREIERKHGEKGNRDKVNRARRFSSYSGRNGKKDNSIGVAGNSNSKTEEVSPIDRKKEKGKEKSKNSTLQARKNSSKQVWTPDSSQEKEIHLLAGLIKLLHGQPVSSVLDPWVGKINRVELSNVIKGLGRRGKALTALGVFQWMEGQPRRLRPNGHVYTLMLGILGRANMVEEAKKLFAKMEAHKFEDKVHGYNSLIGVYCRQGSYDKALALLEDMLSKNCRPDAVTFNTLISGCSTARLPPGTALGLLDRMAKEEVAPNLRTFNAALAVLSKGHLCDEAEKLLVKMQLKGLAPDVVTINTMISLYVRAGRLENAVKTFEEARASGVVLNEVSYTALMDAYNRGGKYREAMATFEAMETAGLKPDMTSYSLLISVYKEVGLVEEAEQVLHRMQVAGIRPNTMAYSTLIQAYGRQGMFEEAGRVFREMQTEGCLADVTVYNILMAAFGQEGLSVQAANLFQSMQKQGLVPNVVSYNTLIHAHFKAGQLLEAETTYRQMVKEGCAPDKVTRWLMMRTYKALGRFHKAIGLRKKERKASTEGETVTVAKKLGKEERLGGEGFREERAGEGRQKEGVPGRRGGVDEGKTGGIDRSFKGGEGKKPGNELEMDGWIRIGGTGDSKGVLGSMGNSLNGISRTRPLQEELASYRDWADIPWVEGEEDMGSEVRTGRYRF